MSDYLKHRYSGRIYQVMLDHGPDHPYLWSPWEYAIRPYNKYLWDHFLIPCEKPPQMPYSYPISIPQEMEWEDRQVNKANLGKIQVRPPKRRDNPIKKTRIKKRAQQEDGYTLKDLCSELGIPPAQARKALRSKGKKAPDGGWKWPNSEAAKSIKEILRNL